ncbi:MAG: DNA polymerase III subunit delta, partial [Mameliella sp.]|nr:DNA polymerase III subunit delta [Mameliella sp.]
MKLSPRDANAFFRKPDPGVAGLLIYGEDVMRVAMKRQEVVAAIVGPEGEAEMRLTRLVGGDLRRDPAQLLDAVKAQGFFPGPRAVLV